MYTCMKFYQIASWSDHLSYEELQAEMFYSFIIFSYMFILKYKVTIKGTDWPIKNQSGMAKQGMVNQRGATITPMGKRREQVPVAVWQRATWQCLSWRNRANSQQGKNLRYGYPSLTLHHPTNTWQCLRSTQPNKLARGHWYKAIKVSRMDTMWVCSEEIKAIQSINLLYIASIFILLKSLADILLHRWLRMDS